MKLFARAPVPELRAVIRRLLVVEFPEGRSDCHLPEPGLIAAFRFGGECLINSQAMRSPAVMSGLSDRMRTHVHSRHNSVLVVHFTPLGAAAFARLPLDELFNQTVDLGDVLGRAPALTRFVDQLAAASGNAQRIRMAEQFFLSCLRDSGPDPLIHAAVSWIEQALPSSRMAHLVRHIGLSQSALERRFRRVVGASPKSFASLHRLAHATRLYRAGTSLTAAAHDAGYYDQAHFNHEFKRVTGLAPGAYFAQAAAG